VTDWNGRTADGAFSAHVQASVLSALDDLCGEAGRLETGGILIGRYSDDLAVAIVCEATPPPPDSRRGRWWFVRGVRGLRDLLGTKWRAKERTYYLGEWHFHPVNHVTPSGDDFEQMLKISRGKEYECREPLLIILSARRNHGGHRTFRAFVCPAGGVPLELVAPNEAL